MELIMSPELKKEQDEIVAKWLQSDEDIDVFDYAIKHASDELRQFLLYEKSIKEKYDKMGIIIN